MTEVLFEIGGQARNLFALILERDGNKDWLVEATAHELDLSSADESFQAGEILRMMAFNPSEQGARVMQAHVDSGVLLEEFDKWKIGVFVRLFEHMTEIAAWLMGMDEQNEMKALRHGDRFLQRHHTVCRKTTDSRDGKMA